MEEIKVSFTDFADQEISLTVGEDGWLCIEDVSRIFVDATSVKDFFEAVDKLKEQLKDKEI